MKRIRGIEQGSPGCAHVQPFAMDPLTLSRFFNVDPPGRGLQMEQFGKRRPDDPITVVSKSQAKINVVKCDGQINFVQSTNFKEYRAPDCGAGAGYGRKRPRESQLSEIAGIILGAEPA